LFSETSRKFATPFTDAILLSVTKRQSDDYAKCPLSLIQLKLSTTSFNQLAFAGEQDEQVKEKISLWVPEPILAVAMRDTAASYTPLTVKVCEVCKEFCGLKFDQQLPCKEKRRHLKVNTKQKTAAKAAVPAYNRSFGKDDVIEITDSDEELMVTEEIKGQIFDLTEP
jgi:hypothetical protein